MVRTFIGIELDPAVVADISQEISYLNHKFPNIKWEKPENIHITLKFLGNVEPDDLRAVFSKTATVAQNSSPFALSIQSTALLPDIRRPRIVCAGCAMGTNELLTLQHEVEKSCSDIGYPADSHTYKPHITMGRIRKPSHAIGMEKIIPDIENIDYGITDVEEIIVYMSELGSKGAEYSPMYRIRLGE